MEIDEDLKAFLVESNENLNQLESDLIVLEQNPADEELLNRIYRALHTLKGNCGFLGLEKLQSVAHAAENMLSSPARSPVNTQSGNRQRPATSNRRGAANSYHSGIDGFGRRSGLHGIGREIAAEFIEKNNDVTLEELCELLKEKMGVLISRATMGRMIKKLNFTWKQKTLHPNEKESDRVLSLRV